MIITTIIHMINTTIVIVIIIITIGVQSALFRPLCYTTLPERSEDPIKPYRTRP